MSVVGHEAQAAAFLAALGSGRFHHAWLLAGPEGVGKATFARAAALTVLAREGSDGLGLPPEHPIARLVAAGSHPELRTLERLPRESDGRLAADIKVEQVRELQPVLRVAPGLSRWRVVIVDPVDALNTSAANAFLKNLEEPPPATLFLLVSHAPGRLLPTIRSRCRTLRFRALSQERVEAVLARALPETSAGEQTELARLSGGAPGRAVRLSGLDAAALVRELEALGRAAPEEARGRALLLSRQLATKTAQPRYEAFLELAPSWLANASSRAQGKRLAQGLALWERAHALAASALPLALEPGAVVSELALMVGGFEREA